MISQAVNLIKGGGAFSTRKLIVELIFPSGETKVIQDLHIDVLVKKSISIEPNTGVVTIYNLSRSTRELISENTYRAHGETPTVIGIKLNDSVVYQNVLINSHSRRIIQEGDWETTLYIGNLPEFFAQHTKELVIPKNTDKADGVTSLLEEVVPPPKAGDDAESEEKPSAVLTMADEFREKLNECKGNKSWARAVTINGEVLENIKRLLRDCFPDENYVLYPSEDGQGFTIADAGEYLKGAEFEVNTGMLIDPPIINEAGITCNIIFNPDPTIQGKLIVKADNFELSVGGANRMQIDQTHLSGEGDYMIKEVVHKVDNFSNVMATTTITAILIGTPYRI